MGNNAEADATSAPHHKVSVSLRISAGRRRELRAMAEAEGKTLTAVIEEILASHMDGSREHRSAGSRDEAQTLAQLRQQVQAMATGMQQLATWMQRLDARMKNHAETPLRLLPVVESLAERVNEVRSAVNGFGPAISAAMADNNANLVERLRAWLRAELGRIFPFPRTR
jgi:hypothetical protein